MGEIKATPRNKLGYIVDALRGVNQLAAKNKYTNMAAELVGTPAIERTLDRVSYGEPITNIGKANVPLIPEDTGEAAMALAPMAISAGKALVKVSPKAQAAALRMMDNAMAPATMNKQSGKVFVYPQDEALATAQRNAAKPVSEGGLGLRTDNTAMERAKAMGYNTPAYHGTSADFSEFSVAGKGKTSGSGAFFTDNPSVASTYASLDGGSVLPTMLQTETPVQVAANGANWNWLGKGVKVDAPKTAENKAAKKTLGKLFPDVFKYEDSLSTDDLARWANNQGYDSVIFDAVKDRGPNGVFSTAEAALPSKNTAMFNPANIRSRFAAFDPARRNEADLLGRADPALLGLIGLGTGAGVYGANK